MKKMICLILAAILCFPAYVFGGDDMAKDREDIYNVIKNSGEYLDVVRWLDFIVVLNKDKKTVSYTFLGNVWVDFNLDVFEESDIEITSDTEFVINDIEVFADQLYLGCDGGLVIVITDCQKCYKVKKVCDFDIFQIHFNGGNAEIYSKEGEKSLIEADVLRQNKIDPSEVMGKVVNDGAILIDVRDKVDFDKENVAGSVNIPIDEIGRIEEYPKNTTLIFCCYSGNRAERAVNYALELGFVSAYNAGSYEDILNM